MVEDGTAQRHGRGPRALHTGEAAGAYVGHRVTGTVRTDQMRGHSGVPGRGQHGLPAQAVHPQTAALFVDPPRGARRTRVGRPGAQRRGAGQQLPEGLREVAQALSLALLPRGSQAPYDTQRGGLGPRKPGQPRGVGGAEQLGLHHRATRRDTGRQGLGGGGPERLGGAHLRCGEGGRSG
ncbi:hypothetical protein STANM309S_01478 [Streptomyces tanashiensis]